MINILGQLLRFWYLFHMHSILPLTPFRPTEFLIKYDTVKPGWSIIYIEGSQVIIFKNIIFLSVRIDFVLVNSADPD